MQRRTDRTAWACLVLMVAAIGMSRPDIINGYQPRPRDKQTVEPMGGWWDVACWFVGWMPGTPCPMPVKDPPMPKPKTLSPDTPSEGTCGDGTFIGPCQQ